MSPSHHFLSFLSTPQDPQVNTHAEILKCQLKGLYYNCDEKYFLGHKCKDKKHFMANLEEISNDEVEDIPQDIVPLPVGDISPSAQ